MKYERKNERKHEENANNVNMKMINNNINIDNIHPEERQSLSKPSKAN